MATEIPSITRSLACLVLTSLLTFLLWVVISSGGRILVFWDEFSAAGMWTPLGRQLTSGWLLGEAFYFVAFPALIVGLERALGPRRRMAILLAGGLGMLLGAGFKILLAQGLTFAMILPGLTPLILVPLASFRPRLGYGLLPLAGYLRFILLGLLPGVSGMLGGAAFVLGLDEPVATLAQVMLIQTPLLGGLLWLVHRWRAGLRRG